MLSLDLDMKLVFPSKKGSKDLSGSIFRNDPPNLGKVIKSRLIACKIASVVEQKISTNSSHTLFFPSLSLSYLYLLDSQVQRPTGISWEHDMF